MVGQGAGKPGKLCRGGGTVYQPCDTAHALAWMADLSAGRVTMRGMTLVFIQAQQVRAGVL